MVKTRPFATEMPENPSPRFFFHTTAGPPFGQVFRNPVSVEIPVRSGPNHWGQSAYAEEKHSTKANERMYFID